MEKRLLVTVSEDLSVQFGARFVGAFFEDKSSMEITLFYVAPIPDPKARRPHPDDYVPDRKTLEAYHERGQRALDAAAQTLEDVGLPQSKVEKKFAFNKYGTVKDLVMEGRKGEFDAVVLGRRGYTLFENVLSNSVSREVLDQRIDFPLWICRPVEKEHTGILLCVDGSDSALRASDHVGFILAQEPRHHVTLLHVDSGETADMETILNEAADRLTDNGIGRERIHGRVVRSSSVAATVMELYREGRFAALAVGRVGLAKSKWKEWIVGSRTVKLLHEIDSGALWVSR